MLSTNSRGCNVNGMPAGSRGAGYPADNARKSTEPPGTVNVRLERWGHTRCRLTVSNPGPPLSAAEQKDIFKRFYRTDPARSRDGSFGLGLSIAQRHHRGAPRAHLGGEQRWIQSLHRGTSGPVTKQTKMLVE